MLPLRDQFLGDDWAAILSTRDLIQTGQLKLSDSMQVSALFLIIWGAIFSLIFGFSTKVLQISVIILLYFALNTFYLLLKRLKIKEATAIIFTLILLFYPYIINYSYSFLTYVPDMSLIIISSYFYVKAIQEKNYFSYLLGSLFAGFSFLTRQTGMALFVAIIVILLYRKFVIKIPSKKEFIYALVPFSLVAFVYYAWLRNPGNMTIAQATVLFYRSPLESLQRFIPVILGRISSTQIYYIKYLDRFTFYLHHLEQFLLPLFFIFTITDGSVRKFILKYKRVIVYLTIVYLIFMAIGYVYSGFKIVIDRPPNEVFPIIPSYIFEFIGIQIHWINFFKFIVIISLFIWIPLIASSLNNIFTATFSKRKTYYIKQFRILSFAGLILSLIFYIKIFMLVYQSKLTSYSEPFLVKFNQYFNLIISETGKTFLYNSWIVPTTIYLAFLGIIYIIFRFKILKIHSKDKISLGFLFLAFWNQLLIAVFLFYYQFPQYVIAFLPFILIWIACLTRNIKISILKASIFIILLIPFSLLPAKSRYESGGMAFEIANLLVKRGVSPKDIYVPGHERSWIPWWYSVEYYDKAIKEAGGDKYKIATLNTPWENLQTIVPNYGIGEVGINFKKSDLPDLEIIEDTGNKYIGVFSKLRGVGYKKR